MVKITVDEMKQHIENLENILKTVPPIQFTYPDRNSLEAVVEFLKEIVK